jgi:hypothetical protein
MKGKVQLPTTNEIKIVYPLSIQSTADPKSRDCKDLEVLHSAHIINIEIQYLKFWFYCLFFLEMRAYKTGMVHESTQGISVKCRI